MSCIDMELLPMHTHTFTSTSNGSLRWLDHCVVTNAAKSLVVKASVMYDVFLSDHLPMFIECNLNLIRPRIFGSPYGNNKVLWRERNSQQIKQYFDYCNAKLRLVDFPAECCNCANSMCNNAKHRLLLDNMYSEVVNILKGAAEHSYVNKVNCKHKKKMSTWLEQACSWCSL
jgi:hypothetical protein